MKIKAGETRYLVRKIETEKSYDNVRFRLTNKKNTIEKSTDAEAVKDKVIVQDGVFLIPLQQKDTADLVGSVTIEAEIDYQDKSVRYTDYNAVYVNESLGWEQITGSKPSDDDGIEPVMEAIEQGIYVIVGPESSQELINAVTELFQDTKQIAQSVRDDADAGNFDGYSPQVTVKTETPSTYVLHIKDADHEFDTPNLQGQGGEGTLEAGDGLKREDNTMSVALDENENNLEFKNGKLYLDLDNLGIGELRSILTNPNLISQYSALADRGYIEYITSTLGNALTVSIDSSTYVMTLQLKHDNTVLSTGTVDLPLESVVVSGSYDSSTKEVVLTLQSGSTIRFSVADLVSGLVSIDTFNSGMATKVDKAQSENNELTLTDNTETSEISVGDYSFLSFDTSHLENDDVLTMYYKIGNTWDSKTISHDSWYEYVYNYDAIKFKVVTTPSSETREFKYSLYNDVIRQRQYSREIGDLQKDIRGKQNIIDASNKLNADYLQNGSTNKTVTQQEKTFWNNRCRVFDAVYSNGSLYVKMASYPNIKENDLIVCNGNNIEAELNGAYLKRVVAVGIGPDADEIALTDIKETYSIQGTPPATAEWGVDFIYQVGNILLSENGNIYYCESVIYDDNIETFTYTWRTYNIASKQDKTDITTDTSSTTVSLTLADNNEYRYTTDLTSLTLTMPNGDFIASVVFSSGSTPTSMTYDSSIKWSGDDITNGQFVPSADKDYDICLYYNGLNVNGIVRGV